MAAGPPWGARGAAAPARPGPGSPRALALRDRAGSGSAPALGCGSTKQPRSVRGSYGAASARWSAPRLTIQTPARFPRETAGAQGQAPSSRWPLWTLCKGLRETAGSRVSPRAEQAGAEQRAGADVPPRKPRFSSLSAVSTARAKAESAVRGRSSCSPRLQAGVVCREPRPCGPRQRGRWAAGCGAILGTAIPPLPLIAVKHAEETCGGVRQKLWDSWSQGEAWRVLCVCLPAVMTYRVERRAASPGSRDTGMRWRCLRGAETGLHPQKRLFACGLHSLTNGKGWTSCVAAGKAGTRPWGTRGAGCWWTQAAVPRPRLSAEPWGWGTPRPGPWAGGAGTAARRARSTARSRATGTSPPPCSFSSSSAPCWVRVPGVLFFLIFSVRDCRPKGKWHHWLPSWLFLQHFWSSGLWFQVPCRFWCVKAVAVKCIPHGWELVH